MFNFRKLKINEKIICRYLGFVGNVGTFKKFVYSFEEKKIVFHLWGYIVLRNLLYMMPVGTEIEMTYCGLKKTDQTRYPAHVFEIKVIGARNKGGAYPTTKKTRKARPRGD